jgi:alkane 1-monooxygenase
VVGQLDADPYYRWLTWATVPLHFVALIACPWWAGAQGLSWWAVVLLAFVIGADSGLVPNTAHELGHKHNDPAWRKAFATTTAFPIPPTTPA